MSPIISLQWREESLLAIKDNLARCIERASAAAWCDQLGLLAICSTIILIISQFDDLLQHMIVLLLHTVAQQW